MSLKGVNDFSHEDYKEMRFLVEETKKGNKDAAAKLYKYVELEMITPSAYERLINEYADVVYVKEKNDYKPLILALLIVLVICVVFIYTAFAHQGKTDSSGGHKDNNNKSGLGSYHFHCGGYPAHLHTNGCPYTSTSSSYQYSTPTTYQTKEDEYDQEAYDAGYEDGFENGYDEGNNEGYNDGYDDGNEKYLSILEEYESLKQSKSNATILNVVLIIILLLMFFTRKKE